MKILASLSFVALSALSFMVPLPACAAGGVPDNVIRGDILGGWTTRQGTRMAALRLTMAPGWKTYWRAPGEAGIPPSFDWSGSRNLGAVTYHWPSPEVFENYGLRTIGYSRELVLPIELHPTTPGAPIELHGKVDLGVCEKICMPANLRIDATLDGAGRADPAIERALANAPAPGSRAGVRRVDCEVEPISDGVKVTARIAMPRLPGAEVAMVETGNPHVWVSEPKSRRKGDILEVQADLVPAGGGPLALDRSAMRFTVIAGTRAVDIHGCTTK
ncbi:protein-disulfide reductase DsbD domain-containing protein [Tropicimonas sp.]|uniref:protein-disulfide reductase DsbD domain-containing protein n=1 Tax=Tropicimonas sp. TaxID=2067044 RepID=UPI003A8768D0